MGKHTVSGELGNWRPRLVDHIEVALSQAAQESGLALSDRVWDTFCTAASNQLAETFLGRVKEIFH